jgi:hypothetical protein
VLPTPLVLTLSPVPLALVVLRLEVGRVLEVVVLALVLVLVLVLVLRCRQWHCQWFLLSPSGPSPGLGARGRYMMLPDSQAGDARFRRVASAKLLVGTITAFALIGIVSCVMRVPSVAKTTVVLGTASVLSLVVLGLACSVGWSACADGAWYMPALHRVYSIAGVLVVAYWFVHLRLMEEISGKGEIPTTVKESAALAVASLLTTLSCYGVLCITTAARLDDAASASDDCSSHEHRNWHDDSETVAVKFGEGRVLRIFLGVAWFLVAALFVLAAVEGGRLLSSGDECDGAESREADSEPKVSPVISALIMLTLDVKLVALIDAVPLLRGSTRESLVPASAAH